MARMIPAQYAEDIKSTGEKQIFELLQRDPTTADWICLHSLGLAKHVKRIYGEIDFVVLIPNEGVFCLEVKSGRVARREGVWVYKNRFNDESKSNVGPFLQAREGMFSLLESIRKRFGQHHRCTRFLFGFGVVFPHIVFQNQSPDIENWQIYDKNTRRVPISRYLLSLAKNTRRKVQGKKWYSEQDSRPSASDLQELLDFLRGDFDLVVKSSDVLMATEAQLLRLTQEQYYCLDQLQDNPRCLFTGAAGTGKTLLALEYARRESSAGKRVLLVCYNRLLAHWLVSETCGPEHKLVVVDSFHRLLEKLIAESSFSDEFRQARTSADPEVLFEELYPLFALDALGDATLEPFDLLLIDEGQDLIRTEYLDVFDTLLRGGLAGGSWAFFCDFYHQTIFGEDDENSMLGELERRSSQFARFRLLTNCRNTRPIGEEVSFISGFEVPPFLPANVEGMPVDYRFYKDNSQQLGLADELIRRLRSEGVDSRHITFLSPVTLKHSCLSQTSGLSFGVADLAESEQRERPANSIAFSTIQAYKGLENSIIIITDVTHISDERFQALLYVGMSRARHRLVVLISETVRDEYNDAIRRSLSTGR